MRIHIKREREFKKGNFPSVKSVKLKLSIAADLSQEEMDLTKKYDDPPIGTLEIARMYEGTDEQKEAIILKPKQIMKVSSSHLSNFKLDAWVDDGLNDLGNLQELEKAVCRALEQELGYLKSLDAWEGEEVTEV